MIKTLIAFFPDNTSCIYTTGPLESTSGLVLRMGPDSTNAIRVKAIGVINGVAIILEALEQIKGSHKETCCAACDHDVMDAKKIELHGIPFIIAEYGEDND